MDREACYRCHVSMFCWAAFLSTIVFLFHRRENKFQGSCEKQGQEAPSFRIGHRFGKGQEFGVCMSLGVVVVEGYRLLKKQTWRAEVFHFPLLPFPSSTCFYSSRHVLFSFLPSFLESYTGIPGGRSHRQCYSLLLSS